jgi:hypothetical protein
MEERRYVAAGATKYHLSSILPFLKHLFVTSSISRGLKAERRDAQGEKTAGHVCDVSCGFEHFIYADPAG